MFTPTRCPPACNGACTAAPLEKSEYGMLSIRITQPKPGGSKSAMPSTPRANDTPKSSIQETELVANNPGMRMLGVVSGASVGGYTLHRELLARGVDVQATSVYRRLAKFDRDGWVASRWAESIDGPQRHCYTLTARGLGGLHELTASIPLDKMGDYAGFAKRRAEANQS